MGGVEVPVGNYRVSGRGLGSLKGKALVAIAKALFAVCPKVWYRRILPRMPRRFERAQALWWLNFDV